MPLEHSHQPAAISKRLSTGPRVSYLRDWVYGAIDGAVTTFAIVAGAIGGELSTEVVLILGFANVAADGFSMAAGNFTSTKAEIEDFERLRKVEEKHLAVDPEGEREEIRQIYTLKGIRGEDLARLVRLITGNRKLWLDTMMFEEYGVTLARRSPISAATATFLAFLAAGLVPLFPFLFRVPHAPIVATCATAVAFFFIGSLKSHWSPRGWVSCGLETLTIGIVAAGLALVIGAALRFLIPEAVSLL
jgi:VIT1/CCC1 family predicted Fe2+/Mn2+ transporter